MARNKHLPRPSVEAPVVPPREGVELLRQQIAKGVELCKTGLVDCDVFRAWRMDAEQVLAEALGRNHPLLDEAVRAGSDRAATFIDDETERARFYWERIHAQSKALEPCISFLEREAKRAPSGAREVTAVRNNPLLKLRRLLSRFHRVVLELRRRREDRSTIQIGDEYDAQDLLRALLSLDFDDVRPEEWTPSYAGRSGKMDFLLKPERIVVEVKVTREARDEKQIGEELLVDIARYRTCQDCKRLVCFVYDPEQHIRNPAALERDLSRPEGEMPVEVVVTPSR